MMEILTTILKSKYLFDTHELLNFDQALTSCSSSFSRILIKPK